ncbi:pyrroloquinoline quinone biosynthesis protein PqqE [Rhodovulum sp. DZ06]|uniref:pyrroloquinoline quinone biosynthesis protein PqqE n=1 Tax=Rhodovulum sp. DZ06 TaxID=3425126 RepID=UPI003D3394C7
MNVAAPTPEADRVIPAQPPMAMLAELTHRCPLSCPYCSNPLELAKKDAELTADQWADIFRQAAALGVLQLHLSGGEPASRRDLEEILKAAVDAGLYTNLITSGIGLTPKRLARLAEIGLDHVQLSVQGVEAADADEIGGYKGGFARKMAVAEEIARLGLPLTLNAVMHAKNLDRLEETVALAERLGARRLEVACVQVHGWALRNVAQLLPSREQAIAARDIVRAARMRLKGRMVIDFVPPDYLSEFPKACMGGWGSTGLNVAPDGKVLPCHAAETIPGLRFENAAETPLKWIWERSAAFNAYRGDDWMQEPCSSCERKAQDHGGCRCQAMALAGDAAATDPVCSKSPHKGAVLEMARKGDPAAPLVYREAAG